MHQASDPGTPLNYSLGDLTGIDRCHLETLLAPSRDTNLLLIMWSHVASNVPRVLNELEALCQLKDEGIHRMVILQEAVDLPASKKMAMGSMLTRAINRPRENDFTNSNEYNKALGDHLVASKVAKWTLTPRDRALFEGIAALAADRSIHFDYKFIDLEDQGMITRHLGYTAPGALARRKVAEDILQASVEPGNSVSLTSLLQAMREIIDSDLAIINKERNDLLIEQIRREREGLVDGEVCVALLGSYHLNVALPFIAEGASLSMIRLPEEIREYEPVSSRLHQGSLHAAAALYILENGKLDEVEVERALFAYLLAEALDARVSEIPRFLNEAVDAPRRRRDVQELTAREITLMLRPEELHELLSEALDTLSREGSDNLAVALGSQLVVSALAHDATKICQPLLKIFEL